MDPRKPFIPGILVVIIEERPNMDIEERIQVLEEKVRKTQMVAGIALGLTMVVGLLAFVQLMSN